MGARGACALLLLCGATRTSAQCIAPATDGACPVRLSLPPPPPPAPAALCLSRTLSHTLCAS